MISCKSGVPGSFTEMDVSPPLFPDISGVVIPVTIAPLNFRFADPSGRLVVLFNGRNTSLSVRGRGKIVIPQGKWKKLMEGSRDDSISVILFSKQKRVWIKYRPFYIHVKSPGDQFLVYNFTAPENGSHTTDVYRKPYQYSELFTNLTHENFSSFNLMPSCCRLFFQ